MPFTIASLRHLKRLATIMVAFLQGYIFFNLPDPRGGETNGKMDNWGRKMGSEILKHKKKSS